jgi:hypothetical protein
MLAIVAQALLLQPHVHALAAADAQAAISAPADHAPQALAECAICRLAASTQLFTPPPQQALPDFTRFVARAAAYADLSVTLTPTPAWRSRAPPLSLR